MACKRTAQATVARFELFAAMVLLTLCADAENGLLAAASTQSKRHANYRPQTQNFFLPLREALDKAEYLKPAGGQKTFERVTAFLRNVLFDPTFATYITGATDARAWAVRQLQGAGGVNGAAAALAAAWAASKGWHSVTGAARAGAAALRDGGSAAVTPADADAAGLLMEIGWTTNPADTLDLMMAQQAPGGAALAAGNGAPGALGEPEAPLALCNSPFADEGSSEEDEDDVPAAADAQPPAAMKRPTRGGGGAPCAADGPGDTEDGGAAPATRRGRSGAAAAAAARAEAATKPDGEGGAVQAEAEANPDAKAGPKGPAGGTLSQQREETPPPSPVGGKRRSAAATKARAAAASAVAADAAARSAAEAAAAGAAAAAAAAAARASAAGGAAPPRPPAAPVDAATAARRRALGLRPNTADWGIYAPERHEHCDSCDSCQAAYDAAVKLVVGMRTPLEPGGPAELALQALARVGGIELGERKVAVFTDVDGAAYTLGSKPPLHVFEAVHTCHYPPVEGVERPMALLIDSAGERMRALDAGGDVPNGAVVTIGRNYASHADQHADSNPAYEATQHIMPPAAGMAVLTDIFNVCVDDSGDTTVCHKIARCTATESCVISTTTYQQKARRLAFAAHADARRVGQHGENGGQAGWTKQRQAGTKSGAQAAGGGCAAQHPQRRGSSRRLRRLVHEAAEQGSVRKRCCATIWMGEMPGVRLARAGAAAEQAPRKLSMCTQDFAVDTSGACWRPSALTSTGCAHRTSRQFLCAVCAPGALAARPLACSAVTSFGNAASEIGGSYARTRSITQYMLRTNRCALYRVAEHLMQR